MRHLEKGHNGNGGEVQFPLNDESYFGLKITESLSRNFARTSLLKQAISR